MIIYARAIPQVRQKYDGSSMTCVPLEKRLRDSFVSYFPLVIVVLTPTCEPPRMRVSMY